MKRHIFILALLAGIALGGIAAFVSLGLVLALVVAIMATVFIVKDFERSIYFLAFYAFIDYILRDVLQILFIATSWDEILLLLCLGLWVCKGIMNARSKNLLERGWRWTPLDIPLIFFMSISIVLFVFNSPSMSIGLQGLRATIQYMFWFFAVTQLLSSFEGVKRILCILLVIGVLIGLYGIYQYIIRVPIPPNWVDINEEPVWTRVFTIFNSPNITGALMVLLIPLGLAFAANQKSFSKKLVYWGTSGVMGACVLFTNTRMAWFACIATLFVYLFIKDKRLIFALLVFIIAVYWLIPSVGSRIDYLLSPEYIVSSLSGGRLIRWINGLRILWDNIYFGVGWGHFGGAVATNNKIANTFYMENYYLKTAVESGLIGAGAFLVLIGNVVIWGLRAIHKVYREFHMEKYNFSVGIFAGLVGVLVHNLVENVFEVPIMNTYFWLMAALLIFSAYSPISESGADGG